MTHIVLWNFKEELSQEERTEAGILIEEKLTGLIGKVDGIVSLEVNVNAETTSNRDIALLSVFATKEALEAYQVHPEHCKAAEYVRSITCDRVCFDY